MENSFEINPKRRHEIITFMQIYLIDKISKYDPMENIIEVKDVKKRFKTYESGSGAFGFFRRKNSWKNALNGVSFEVKKEEIVALLGRNGSGKSTLIKIISGILYPDSGTVRIFGLNPWKERIKVVKDIGVVFGSTHPQLFWDLPPIDTFKYIRDLYEINDKDYNKRLDELVKMLDLKEVYKRQTRQLSLGERMKCEIVAAILQMPKLVIMDEPTVGVDLPSRISITKAMLNLRKKFGITFVITTHVVDDIINSDRIIILDHGIKLFDGTQEQLKNKFDKIAILELYFTENMPALKKNYLKLGKVIESKEGYIKIEIKPDTIKSSAFMKIFNDKSIRDYRLSEPGLSSILEMTYKGIDKKSKKNKQ